MRRARETAAIVGERDRPRAACRRRACASRTGALGGPPDRGHRARGARGMGGLAARRRRRSASRAASRWASTRSACSPRWPTSPRARCPRSSSATAARSARARRRRDPRGLDAFHDRRAQRDRHPPDFAGAMRPAAARSRRCSPASASATTSSARSPQHAFTIAADPSPLAPARYAADLRVAPPRIDDPGYVPFLQELVERTTCAPSCR